MEGFIGSQTSLLAILIGYINFLYQDMQRFFKYLLILFLEMGKIRFL